MDGLSLLHRAREAGLAVQAEGDRLVIRGPKRAASVARLLLDHKPDILAALAPHPARDATTCDENTADRMRWRDRYAARIVHWFLGGKRTWRDAERLAYGEMILEWHQRHAAKVRPGHCAGCGDDLPEGAGLIVDRDDTRVHFDGGRGVDCIVAHGTSCRGAAVAGLQALGLYPPEGFELL